MIKVRPLPLLFLIFLNELQDVVKDDVEDASADAHNEVVICRTPYSFRWDEANLVPNWLSKIDIICSSDKLKLLIVSTHSNRQSKLEHHILSLKVNICGEEKQETTSEKLIASEQHSNV